MRTFVADPAGSGRLYALQAGDVLRSEDGGATWELGLHPDAGGVRTIALAPSDPRVVYAGIETGEVEGRVVRSVDGGVTWSPTAPMPRGHGGLPLAVAPSDPDRVIAIERAESLVYSADGGATWTVAEVAGSQVKTPFAGASQVVFDPSDPAVVYGVGSDDCFRSEDGGANWSPAGSLPSEANDLAAHPTAPGVLFASSRLGVHRSVDRGDTWQLLGGGEALLSTWALAVDPEDGDHLVAAAGRTLLTSEDGGANWVPEQDRLASGFIDRVAIAGGSPGTIYAATRAGLVAQSGEDAPWEVRTPHQASLRITDLLAPTRGPLRLFAGSDEGLYESVDHGATWDLVADASQTLVSQLAADFQEQPHLFAVALGALLTSADGGRSWTDIAPPNAPPGVVAPDLRRAGTLYGFSSVQGFFRSVDGGSSWTNLGPVDNDCFTQMVPDPAAAGVLFGAARCCVEAQPDPCGGVFVTDDGWTTRRVLRDFGGALAFSPPSTLFAGDHRGVFRSTDRGTTWELVSDEIETYGIDSLLVDPTDPRTVVAGVFPDPHADPPPGEPSQVSVILSEDGGETWRRFDRGLPDGAEVTRLAIDSRRPELVFAAVRDHGLYRLQRREIPEVPEPPAGPWLTSSEVSGFRVKVQITATDGSQPPVRREPACIPETLCASGAVPGRSEVFVRVVGPKPNGYLWPTLVKFSTSTLDVWIEQTSTGIVRYYRLDGASPGVDELPGRFDRTGFLP